MEPLKATLARLVNDSVTAPLAALESLREIRTEHRTERQHVELAIAHAKRNAARLGLAVPMANASRVNY